MVVNPKGDKGIITEEIQNGPFREVQEYKYLGVWMDVTGKYNINIQKIEKKIPYMITTIKTTVNTSNMGTLAASARLKLMESVVMSSILYGVEAYPNITKKEMDRLERIQGKILRELFGMPPTTSYMAMLMETGILTMEAKMNYKWLMIYHNILKSDEKRLVKKVIEQQILQEREGTWYSGVKEVIVKFG